MSLTRQFFREFRPLFRMLEEPFTRSPTMLSRNRAFNDPFFRDVFPASSMSVPAVDVSEEPGAYVVEAELPGVKKENIDVRIGDGGQSLTIEGRAYVRSSNAPETPAQETASQASSPPEATSDTQAVTQAAPQSTQLTTERSFSSSSQFSRTIWLPRRVDGSGVSAKLEDGILTVRVPKAVDQESVKINIE